MGKPRSEETKKKISLALKNRPAKTNSYSTRIGKAGELRVASELLLRGHGVCFNLVDSGIDMIIENDIKIQVKASKKSYNHHRAKSGKVYACTPCYQFSMFRWGAGARHGNKRSASISDAVHFLIFWAIDDDWFFVIPAEKVRTKTGMRISGNKEYWTKDITLFFDRWDYLKKDGGEA